MYFLDRQIYASLTLIDFDQGADAADVLELAQANLENSGAKAIACGCLASLAVLSQKGKYTFIILYGFLLSGRAFFQSY